MYDELPQTNMPLSQSSNVLRKKTKKRIGLSLVVALSITLVVCAGILTYLRYTDRLDGVWQALVGAYQAVANWLRSLSTGGK